jgi:hypothetical protein
MEQPVAELITLIAVVTGLSVAYGKAFGPYQTQVAQWVIDALGIARRYRGLVNLGTGVAIATAFTVVAAGQLGQPGIIAIGVLAGVFASVEAGRVHDREASGRHRVTDRPSPQRVPSSNGVSSPRR